MSKYTPENARVFVEGQEVKEVYNYSSSEGFFIEEQESDTLMDYRDIEKKIYDIVHAHEGMIMDEKSYEQVFSAIQEVLSTYVSSEDREIEKEILKGYMIHSLYMYNMSLHYESKRFPVNQKVRDEWNEKEEAYEKKQEKNTLVSNEPTIHELSAGIYNNLIGGN